MTEDMATLAALHARCFTRPAPWSADALAGMLDDPHCFLLRAQSGFLIGRAVGDEAELLTLAVAPEARRAGTGGALVAAFSSRAAEAGAALAFLEVARDNGPARRLYGRAGWVECGLRRRYYGPDLDAIVMRLTLRADQEGS